jgi:hypothetical protein
MQQPSSDFSKGAAYVRGEYVPIGQACVPITDWGFLRSVRVVCATPMWRLLLTDQQGNVVEGPGFNVFVFSQGALVTPR